MPAREGFITQGGAVERYTRDIATTVIKRPYASLCASCARALMHPRGIAGDHEMRPRNDDAPWRSRQLSPEGTSIARPCMP